MPEDSKDEAGSSHPLRWPEDAAPAGQRPPRRWARGLLGLPALLWVPGTLICLVVAVANAMTFFGAPVEPERARTAHVALIAAGVCWLGAPVVGLVLARLADSYRATWLYAVAVAMGCLPWVAALALVVHEADNQPDRPARVVCQEHSGGINTCPGG